nr:MAG TPA: hypothetical protein [Caudoviricetes sp.]DAS92254.1 MAG TPA: hypothetical protein [Caudoviricetes sp.]
MRRYKQYLPENYNDLIFIIVSLNIYKSMKKILTSSLVRLGKRKE